MPISASLRQTKVGCPQQNAFAESFVSAIKRECVNKMIFLGDRPLHRAISQYVEHFHRERTTKCRHEAKNHQGIENVIPFPNAPQGGHDSGLIVKSERLGGVLNYYYRENRKDESLVA